MMEYIDKYVEKFYNALAVHPKIGLIFIILCLGIWLLGIILNWKWTYEKGSTLMDYFLNGIFSESQYRIIVGIMVFLALVAVIGLIIIS